MKLNLVPNPAVIPKDIAPHFVFVAHDGFTPIDAVARHGFGLELEAVRAFIRSVNERQEAGSLLPAAPVSAFPLAGFLPNGSHVLQCTLHDFMQTNEDSIRAAKIVFDLRLFHPEAKWTTPHHTLVESALREWSGRYPETAWLVNAQ